MDNFREVEEMKEEELYSKLIKDIYKEVKEIKFMLIELNKKVTELEVKAIYHEKEIDEIKNKGRQSFYLVISSVITFMISFILLVINFMVKKWKNF